MQSQRLQPTPAGCGFSEEIQMQTNFKELMAVKFAEAMGRLKALGLKGEITVQPGVVMIATTCKWSASHFRKGIKTACANTGATWVENRPSKEARVFTVVI